MVVELEARSFTILDPAENVNYGKQALPSERDRQIRDLLVRVGDQRAFGELTGLVPRGGWSVLNVFAERVASLAVRHQDAHELRVGLLAAAAAYLLTDDFREVMPTLALLYRAAELTGHDPDSEFFTTNELCGGQEGPLLDFLRRAPADKTIAVMGFKEGEDQHGFRFTRNW